MLQLADLGMFSVDTEFLFMITDTSSQDSHLQQAFSGQCEQGVRCLVASLGATLARGWDNTLRGEMPLFKKVADIIRASKGCFKRKMDG